ncbi:hypothetical protein BN946_scf185042.g69 [Trametes cinnabarina]|uniref:Uncharacterized protein n=1 Tax=Pycnoporus cinnabarinus TaxID=5643 RepID=A0A060S412_PYCCI|nr:hypothetical protein BN946_scf185042.g69 [Trametes cinnabarina]
MLISQFFGYCLVLLNDSISRQFIAREVVLALIHLGARLHGQMSPVFRVIATAFTSKATFTEGFMNSTYIVPSQSSARPKFNIEVAIDPTILISGVAILLICCFGVVVRIARCQASLKHQANSTKEPPFASPFSPMLCADAPCTVSPPSTAMSTVSVVVDADANADEFSASFGEPCNEEEDAALISPMSLLDDPSWHDVSQSTRPPLETWTSPRDELSALSGSAHLGGEAHDRLDDDPPNSSAWMKLDSMVPPVFEGQWHWTKIAAEGPSLGVDLRTAAPREEKEFTEYMKDVCTAPSTSDKGVQSTATSTEPTDKNAPTPDPGPVKIESDSSFSLSSIASTDSDSADEPEDQACTPPRDFHALDDLSFLVPRTASPNGRKLYTSGAYQYATLLGARA